MSSKPTTTTPRPTLRSTPTPRPGTKAAARDAAIRAGRMALAEWLHAAEEHGTIYYAIESVSRSGMARKITLSTIRLRQGECQDDGPSAFELCRCWPHVPAALSTGLSPDAERTALDDIARDWGFSWKHRAFDVHGCGMDMVFALVDRLARIAGVSDGSGLQSYANRVRREAF